ncbi:hypothetical protein RvY_07790 [Ramazzottius varieornatus]|uniref:Mss4-like protein n=1 Tax=Ramazzottius varieornatus TaxID=947166 RepID=A0A1D1V3H6_RAMVA|nr:hypothetical protein RvY_07790 [Ramazzottius varieornatus]
MAQAVSNAFGVGSSSSAAAELASPHPPGTNRSESVVEPMHSRTNPKRVVCLQCGSKILLPETAAHVRKNVFLPHMKLKPIVAGAPQTFLTLSKSDEDGGSEEQTAEEVLYVLDDVPGEVLHDFWMVKDMYTFENVGFSHAVGKLKYLTCADCEVGPIGYHDMEKLNEFFVAWSRVGEK